MRKVLVSLLALMVAAGIAAPASGDPNVRRDEGAQADWFVPTGEKNRFLWLGAYVSRSTVVGGTAEWFSYAGFVKGRCIREKTPRYISISCNGRDFIPADPEKDFEMSALATEASLRVRHEGETHAVRWSARGPGVGTYLASEYCASFEPGEEEPKEEGQGEGGGIWNDAEATGKLFGYRFADPGKARWPGLMTGVMVTTCSFRDVDYSPDGRITGVSFRIPR